MSKNSMPHNNESVNDLKLADNTPDTLKSKDKQADNLRAKDKPAGLKNISPSSLRAKSLSERRRDFVTPEIGEVPVRKPNKQKFFIVKEGPEWEGEYDVIELKQEKEYYVLSNDYTPPIDIIDDTKRVMLNLCQNIDDGSVFLMPTTIPNPEDEDKKWVSWSRSQFRCIEMAKKTPIRMKAFMTEGGYRPFISEIPAEVRPLPGGPGKVFDDFVMRAFEGKIVSSDDHPVVHKLRRKKLNTTDEMEDEVV
jgi:hypothetical protein